MPKKQVPLHHNAKINWRIVRAIRRSSKGPTELAEKYGISKSHVVNIRACRYWLPQDDPTRERKYVGKK